MGEQVFIERIVLKEREERVAGGYGRWCGL